MSDNSQRQLEMKLAFVADASRAAAPVKQLTQDIEKMDRATKEAQKSLDRMSQSERAAGGGGGAYGVAGAQGQSAASAYSQHPGTTRYSHGYVGPPPGNSYPKNNQPPRPGPNGGGDDMFGGMAGKAAMALTAVAIAADRFAQSMERNSTMLDAGGNRLSRGRQTGRGAIETFSSVPLSQTLANGFEYSLHESVLGRQALMAAGKDPNRRQNAFEDSYQASKSLSEFDTRTESNRSVEDLQRRSRALGIVPGATSSIGFNTYYDQYKKDPAMASAMMGQDRAGALVEQARQGLNFANRDVQTAANRENNLRWQVGNARRNVDSRSDTFSPLSRMAASENSADRDRVMLLEKQHGEALNQLQDAQNRKLQSSLELNQKIADMKRANLDVAKAELALTERNLEKAEGSAVEFALMKPSEQMSLLEDARKFKAGNLSDLDADQRRRLLSSGPFAEMVRKELINSQSGNATFKEFLELSGSKSVADLQNLKKVQMEGVFKLEMAPQEAEKLAAEIEKKIIPELIKLTNEKLENRIRILEQNQANARAAQGAG